MRQTALSRLVAQLTARRPGWRSDWVRVAFALAVLLLIAVGVFMTVAVAAQGEQSPSKRQTAAMQPADIIEL